MDKSFWPSRHDWSDIHFQYWQNFMGHDDKDWQIDSTTLNVTGTCDTEGQHFILYNRASYKYNTCNAPEFYQILHTDICGTY